MTTYTLDLAAPLVQVFVEHAAHSTQYLYGVTRIEEQQPTGWAYHLSDALGRLALSEAEGVRQLADGSAQVTLARGYMPYGEPLWSVGDGNSEYGFTSEDWNTVTQLVFLRARYMQPGLGMFLSHDPWDGDGLRPGSMNGWNYAEDNPINAADPSGRDIGEDPNKTECAGCKVTGAHGTVEFKWRKSNPGYFVGDAYVTIDANPNPDYRKCIFILWIKGYIKATNKDGKSIISSEYRTEWPDWDVDYPFPENDPRSKSKRLNPGDDPHLIEGTQYLWPTKNDVRRVLQGTGNGWIFTDPAGFPYAGSLNTGAKYEIMLDFLLGVYDSTTLPELKRQNFTGPNNPSAVLYASWHDHVNTTVR